MKRLLLSSLGLLALAAAVVGLEADLAWSSVEGVARGRELRRRALRH